MTISDDLEAQILRYYHAEKWRVGTISRQLGIHYTTVKRVLYQAGIPQTALLGADNLIWPFLPFLLETLKKFPTLTASRLYDMVRERGYEGGPDHFRHLIALHRPRPCAEAFLRLKTLPGEQAQVDWGHFGHITIGKARRSLMAFVMVLSTSRVIFLRFYVNARMGSFLRGHVSAFTKWDGIPRVLLYDNLKSAVLERQGDAIRFHPTLLAFAAHYRYEPRPVAVARGNEKGRVERAIRFVRDNFFAGREWIDLDDLNAQAEAWCDGRAADRPCPEDKSQSVREVFLREQPMLMPLPDNPYPTEEREEVKIGKTPYARFDLNDYSVPHTHVRRLLTVVAGPDSVAILDGADLIVRHKRSYDKGQQIEEPAHVEALIERKRKARQHRGQSHLSNAVPAATALMVQAAERGYNLGSITAELLRLLDQYNATELECAVVEALSRGVPHPNAVRLVLERRRDERQQPPPIAVTLPKDRRVRDLVVTPHRLQDYDNEPVSTIEEIAHD